jgi:hypothetical protein
MRMGLKAHLGNFEDKNQVHTSLFIQPAPPSGIYEDLFMKI